MVNLNFISRLWEVLGTSFSTADKFKCTLIGCKRQTETRHYREFANLLNITVNKIAYKAEFTINLAIALSCFHLRLNNFSKCLNEIYQNLITYANYSFL